jgi:hypothetical protein
MISKANSPKKEYPIFCLKKVPIFTFLIIATAYLVSLGSALFWFCACENWPSA